MARIAMLLDDGSDDSAAVCHGPPWLGEADVLAGRG